MGASLSIEMFLFFFIRVSIISKQLKTNYSMVLHVKHILSFKQYTADQSSFFFYFNKEYDDQVEGPSLASSIRSSAGSFADASSRTRMTTTVVMDQPSPDSTNFQNFRKNIHCSNIPIGQGKPPKPSSNRYQGQTPQMISAHWNTFQKTTMGGFKKGGKMSPIRHHRGLVR